MQPSENYIETGFPSSYQTFSQVYNQPNPYVENAFLKSYPLYIAPEFGKYYTDPLRGPMPKTLNSAPYSTGKKIY
jgi:hypothetical protein